MVSTVRRTFICSSTDSSGVCAAGQGLNTEFLDEFSLTMNGQTYNLRPHSTDAGEYVTEEYAPLRIRRCNSTLACTGAIGIPGFSGSGASYTYTNQTGEFWQVWTPDGVRYVFGTDTNSENAIQNEVYNYTSGNSSISGSPIGRAWFLRYVYAPYRDDASDTSQTGGKWSVRYTYGVGTGEIRSWYGTNYYQNFSQDKRPDPWQRPDTIEYGNSQRPGGERSKVSFSYEPDNARISSITTQQAGQNQHLYTFKYASSQWDREWWLSSVMDQPWSRGTNQWARALPKTNFNYTKVKGDEDASTRLTKITNGYGGEWVYQYLTTTYSSDNTTAWVVTAIVTNGVNLTRTVRTYDYSATRCVADNRSLCVNATHIFKEDWGSSLTGFAQVTETLMNANGSAFAKTIHKFNVTDYRLIGREYETAQADSAGSVLIKQTTEYSIFDAANGLPLGTWLAVPTRMTAYPKGNDATVYRRTDTSYSFPAASITPRTLLYRGEKNGNDEWTNTSVPFEFSTWKDAWQLPTDDTLAGTVPLYACAASAHHTKVNSNDGDYDVQYMFVHTSAACLGATNKGQIGRLHTAQSAGMDPVKLCQRARGNGNQPMWYAGTYQTDCTFGTLGYAYPVYHLWAGGLINPSYATTQTLALQAQPVMVSEYARDVGDANPRLVRSTSSTYALNPSTWVLRPVLQTLRDEQLNQVATETKYSWDYQGYGSAPTKGKLTRIETGKTGDVWTSLSAQYDAFGNTTLITDALNYTSTATYDASGDYVVATTNAKGYQSNYVYFGINEGTAVTDQPYGLLRSIRDPNNTTVEFRYDDYGRLVKEIRPGDTVADPTMFYVYGDVNQDSVTPPLSIQSWQRETSGCSGCVHPVFTFYDGLGRAIQTKSEDINGLRLVEVNTRYNALGQKTDDSIATYQTFPSLPVSPAFFAYDPPATNFWASPSKTSYVYDALGRATVITGPDGVATKMAYDGLAVAVLDGNGHNKVNTSDVLGRLVRVTEFGGIFSVPTFNPTLYDYFTSYAYDAQDKLTGVQDTLLNTTVITYDVLGRKTGMRDPDMGTWKYEYDVAGNLITQTDALNQVLWFKYDKLNRMTEKRLTNISGILLSSYLYDVGANAIGRRIAMTSSVDNNAAAWQYDSFGRVLTETRTISGTTMPFTTSFSYDAADRITAVTYPNSETVTTTYNNAMQPVALRSSTFGQDLVKSATYNVLGQMQRMDFGNALSTKYAYWGQTTQRAVIQSLRTAVYAKPA